MDLFLIDANGPFFRDYRRKRVNWSKIPFPHLDATSDTDWLAMVEDLKRFADGATRQGYNAVSLDDLAHLAHHPLHEDEVRERIARTRERFTGCFDLLQSDFGLKIYLTSDVLPVTPAMESALGGDRSAIGETYPFLIRQTLEDFPQLSGLILRIGESDGTDVEDPIRTRLHVRTPEEANRLLLDLLPDFEQRSKDLIFRTWTVGAHRIGDLIWHRDTLRRTLDGIDSDRLIVSMKHGESDFFRHLPLNRAFHRVKHQTLLELQARREYEGAGEYPSFIGWECERFAEQLADCPNLRGISVWCQTGGWHRFRRRAFLEENKRDIWIRLNTQVAITVFKEQRPALDAVVEVLGEENARPALELLHEADVVIRELLYLSEFAKQKWFFRRVRIPPLFHVYWDCLFINHGVRKLIRHFITDTAAALDAGEAAAARFPHMRSLAEKAELPLDDIEHMEDFMRLVLLARRYYLGPYDESLADEILAAKAAYKLRWPKEIRSRYRIKISFKPLQVRRRTVSLAAGLLLRRQRGYRWFDRIFTLALAGVAWRTLRPRDPAKMPKFLRKSAMGVDAVLR